MQSSSNANYDHLYVKYEDTRNSAIVKLANLPWKEIAMKRSNFSGRTDVVSCKILNCGLNDPVDIFHQLKSQLQIKPDFVVCYPDIKVDIPSTPFKNNELVYILESTTGVVTVYEYMIGTCHINDPFRIDVESRTKVKISRRSRSVEVYKHPWSKTKITKRVLDHNESNKDDPVNKHYYFTNGRTVFVHTGKDHTIVGDLSDIIREAVDKMKQQEEEVERKRKRARTEKEEAMSEDEQSQ